MNSGALPSDTQTWLDAFDRVAVISLATRGDRRNAIDRNLRARFGVGVDDVGAFFDAVQPTDQGTFHSIGERGCFESHLAVLKAAHRDGVEHLLVLEDDAEFAFGTASALLDATQDLMAREWDQAYFGYVNPYGDTFGSDDSAASGDGEAARWLRITGSARQAHCVAFRPRGIEAAIAFLEVCHAGMPDDHLAGPMPVDGAYNVLGTTNTDLVRLAIAPSLVSQRRSRSDITRSIWDQIPLIRSLNDARRWVLASARR